MRRNGVQVAEPNGAGILNLEGAEKQSRYRKAVVACHSVIVAALTRARSSK
jgi:hypothetical protein